MMDPYGETCGRAQQGRSAPDRDQTGIYSWDLLYDYGTRQDEMWRHYLKRMEEAGASREPQAGKSGIGNGKW